jgi:hypothetical protein
LRAGLPGSNEGGKSFVADRRINEPGGVGDYAGESEGAGGTTLLVRIGLGGVAVTVVTRGFRIHFRAAIRFLDFRNEWFARNGSESERTREDKPKQELQRSSHPEQLTIEALGRSTRISNLRLSEGGKI